MNNLLIFFENSTDLMAIVGEDGSLKRTNPAFQEALGWDASGNSEKSFLDCVPPEDQQTTLEFLAYVSKENVPQTATIRILERDSFYHPIEWHASRDETSRDIYIIGRKPPSSPDSYFEKILDATPVAMLACDKTGNIIFANRQVYQLFIYEPGSLTGKPLEVLIPDRFRGTHTRHREGYTRSPHSRPMGKGRELPGRKSDGSEVMLEVGLNPIQFQEETIIVCALIDLTAQKRTEQSIRELSRDLEVANASLTKLVSADSLTNLKNRRYFLEQLEFHLRLAQRLKSSISVIMIDVDHFKTFNDTYGHPAGDDILVAIAQLLCKRARVTDIVARYGGEEFVIILPNTSRQNATMLAEQYRSAVEQHKWTLTPVTTSIGAATLNFGNGGLEYDPKMGSQLISLADRALYHSKHTGRNRVSHWDDITS